MVLTAVSLYRSLEAIQQTLNCRECEGYQAFLGAASVIARVSDIETVSDPKGTSAQQTWVQKSVTVLKSEGQLLQEGNIPSGVRQHRMLGRWNDPST